MSPTQNVSFPEIFFEGTCIVEKKYSQPNITKGHKNRIKACHIIIQVIEIKQQSNYQDKEGLQERLYTYKMTGLEKKNLRYSIHIELANCSLVHICYNIL